MVGKMIAIEGIEGAGKSSAMAFVAEQLSKKKVTFITTREPGGTKVGESLRNILIHEAEETIQPQTELLLMYASRVQLFHNSILPTLAKGIWVLSDRFELSSFAYQGGGRQLDLKAINAISHLCLSGFKPDLTLYLDVDYDTSQQRIAGRDEIDRIEQEKAEFFNRVREIYLAHAQSDSSIVHIDAKQSLDAVQQQITQSLSMIWN